MENKIFLDKNSIWRLLKFDKGDIFAYLIFGTVLIYIWTISNIKSMYLLPFIIFIGFLYLRQDYYHKIDIQSDHILEDIKIKVLGNKYPNISKNDKMLLFLNSIYIYHKYNPVIFNDFLNINDRNWINTRKRFI